MRTITKLARRRWTVQEFLRMGELGILPECGVELIDGEVVEKNGLGSPRRWSYEDVLRMIAAGVLGEGERIELIDGDIVC